MTTPESRIPSHPGPAIVGRPHWLSEFVRTRDWASEGRDADLRAALRAGDLHPVSRGVARWRESRELALRQGAHPRDDAHLARVRGAMLVAPADAVVSHASAALLWGMTHLDDWPMRAMITVPPGRDGHSTRYLERHAHPLGGDVVEFGGLRVTSAPRTVADVARMLPRDQAFALAGTALFQPRRGQPMTDLGAVRARLDSMGAARGVRAARHLVETVGVGCESPAEAVSVLRMLDLGFSRPEQQVSFVDSEGEMVVDCFWRDSGIVGECDGVIKYVRDDTGDGRGAAAVVVAEKRREDRLRALGLRVVRWMTTSLRDVAAFGQILASAGVPRDA